LGIVGGLAVVVVALVGPVDDGPIESRAFYQQTIAAASDFAPKVYPAAGGLTAAWARVNITPIQPMPMAGYAPRDRFESVHDSVYVRILAIGNGSLNCFFISADLLLFPRALADRIRARQHAGQFIYFTATHLHSSLGAWDDSVFGNVILGRYNPQWLDSLTDKVVAAMAAAERDLKPARVSYFESDASAYVENRLDPAHGATDGKIRGLAITRADSSRGLIVTYSAHATNISHLSRALSGDYPGALVRRAESRGFDFSMFASGNVGSHRVRGMAEHEFALCDTLAAKLFDKVKTAPLTTLTNATVATGIVSVAYGPSQVHILRDYKIRDWVFRLLFAPLKGNITYLKIGHVLFLGMPCDFSGEILVRDSLDAEARQRGEHLIVTSFNGDYVGYITYDDHYGHSEQEEVMAMNWVGPHYGNYFSTVVKTIIEK